MENAQLEKDFVKKSDLDTLKKQLESLEEENKKHLRKISANNLDLDNKKRKERQEDLF